MSADISSLSTQVPKLDINEHSDRDDVSPPLDLYISKYPPLGPRDKKLTIPNPACRVRPVRAGSPSRRLAQPIKLQIQQFVG